MSLFLIAAAGCAVTHEELETGDVESAASVHQWEEDTQIPNQSSKYQPGLAYFNNRLHMVHSGSSNPRELWWSRWDGSSWTTNVKLAHTSTGGPALAALNGQLVMIYRAYGENRLMMATSNGSSWSSAVTAGRSLGRVQLRTEPAAAVHNGALYVAYCTSSGVLVDRYVNSSWTAVAGIALPSSTPYSRYVCEHVELAVLPATGRLHAVYSVGNFNTDGAYLNNLMYEVTTASGTSWTSPAYLPMKSRDQPISIVTCDGLTHLVHGGFSTPSEIWWSEHTGDGWAQDVRVPDQTSKGGAALGCFAGTRPLMVHNGGTDQLWQSEWKP